MRPAGLSDSSFHDCTLPSGPFTSTYHHECGLTFSSLVSVPVMVNSFWVSNSAFAEWCARAGAPIISSASAAADPMTILFTSLFTSLFTFLFTMWFCGPFSTSVRLVRRFLPLHRIGNRKHDVRIGAEERDVQVGERLAVERPLHVGREDHPD